MKTIPETIECPHCHGTGQEQPDCETCHGHGWEKDPSDGGTMTCTECDNETCTTCNGETVIDNPEAKPKPEND